MPNESAVGPAPLRVLALVPSMLAYWDRQLRCCYANAAYERWFGVEGAAVEGTTLASLLGPELFALNEPHARAALSGEPQTFERVVPHKDGSHRYGLAHYIPDWQGDEVAGFAVEVTDVTELHRVRLALAAEHERCQAAYQRLQRSEAALLQAQRLCKIGSWEWEIDADIVTWSEQLYGLFGLDPRRLPPSYAEHASLYTAESWARLDQAVRALLAGGAAFRLDLQFRRADGTTGWLEGRGAAEIDGAGRVVRLHGTARDISQERMASLSVKRGKKLVALQRLLQQERTHAKKIDQALAQAKKLEVLGLLAGGIAHDFNNVLAAVSGSLHLLKRKIDDPGALELVARGLGAVERATRLVRQLMGFARTQTIDAQLTDMATLLNGCKQLLQLTVGPTIRVLLDTSQTGRVLVDPYQLEVALLNLAINARDAMPGGGTLRLGVHREDAAVAALPTHAGWLTLELSDTGAGMDAQTLARAREPFFTTKAAGQGTGLGLAMVSAFAERSGGHLSLDSTLGIGTTVRLKLPLAAADAQFSPAHEQEVLDRALHGNAQILVVEDDDLVRPTVVQYLSDLGYEVVAVDDAAQALALARTDRAIDLVITDVAMPTVNGVQLAQAVRLLRPQVEVLLMTGHADPGQLAGEAVLQKPFSQATLAQSVLTVLGRRLSRAPSLAHRIRHPSLVAFYDTWSSRRAPRSLATLAAMEIEKQQDMPSIFVVEVIGLVPFELRRLHVGAELDHQANRALDFGFAVAEGDLLFGGLEAAYRRCARRKEPVYEYMRFQTEAGVAVVFERLLLPCCDDTGKPSYMVGMVKMANAGGLPRQPGATVKSEPRFDDPDLAQQVEQLHAHEINRLPFGVIRLDSLGNVEFFSAREAEQSGWDGRPNIGLDFFTRVAPCMNTPAFKGVLDAAIANGSVDAEFLHTGDFADPDRSIRIRALSSADGGVWLFLQRELAGC